MGIEYINVCYKRLNGFFKGSLISLLHMVYNMNPKILVTSSGENNSSLLALTSLGVIERKIIKKKEFEGVEFFPSYTSYQLHSVADTTGTLKYTQSQQNLFGKIGWKAPFYFVSPRRSKDCAKT